MLRPYGLSREPGLPNSELVLGILVLIFEDSA